VEAKNSVLLGFNMATAAQLALSAPGSLPKIANPAPLGLAAFGVTTVLLSCINARLLPPEALSVVVPLAFAFGGVAQLMTGVSNS
jgi:succinate-acetate transporter protein